MGEYEARTWPGWHHHMTMVLLTEAFLLTLQSETTDRLYGIGRAAALPGVHPCYLPPGEAGEDPGAAHARRQAPHAVAAVEIARRGVGFGERLRDGLAWAPGCDPPARTARSASSPAS